MVRHHHERYDGKGYPDGLSGEEIPLGARILAVADTFDALRSERPYRLAMSAETACAEIQSCKGSQFDPEVAEAFLRTKTVTGLIV
jgi:HD-GYP domain-containing protein (c-di-GMP phosphodiesterase class II)